MILDILKKSKEEKQFIGIWMYGDNEGFFSGYVKDFTEDFVILQHFTKYGKPDGLIVEKLQHIECIEFDNEYSKVMEHLVENADKIENGKEINISITNPAIWQIEILEEQIGRKDRIVKIEVNGNYYTGFVVWCDEESLILNLVGKDGEDNGKTIFKTEDITSIRINDMENRKRMLLYHWRK